jgi:hypothetical protein
MYIISVICQERNLVAMTMTSIVALVNVLMNDLVKGTIVQEDRVLDPVVHVVILILLLTIVKNAKTVKTEKMVETD